VYAENAPLTANAEACATVRDLGGIGEHVLEK
jgi:hypothetical protein